VSNTVRGDVERLGDAARANATSTAASAHRGGTTPQRSDRIRRGANVEGHRGGDQSGVDPCQAGECPLGVQDAGEVLQYGAKRGAAGSGFRGLDEEVQRGGFGIGGRGVNGGGHAVKLTRQYPKYQVLQ
jgi:hypothetical protein